MPADAELLATLPPFRRGLWPLRLAREGERRRNSPRGRAGAIGGRISARIRQQTRKEEARPDSAAAGPRPAGRGYSPMEARP